MDDDHGGDHERPDRPVRRRLPAPGPGAEPRRLQLQAAAFGAVACEYGALSYREFRADDVGEGFAMGPGEVMTVAVAEFTSRDHRDEVMAKVMEDARVQEMMAAEQPADMTRMAYGGFAPLVSVSLDSPGSGAAS